jgi:hypothetical protein
MSVRRQAFARRMAGSMTPASGIDPYVASASAMPATEPRTPDAR